MSALKFKTLLFKNPSKQSFKTSQAWRKYFQHITESSSYIKSSYKSTKNYLTLKNEQAED